MCLLKPDFRFVDRDMFMRFHSGGVGHKATNTFTSDFYPENNPASSNAADLDGVSLADVSIDDEEAWLMEEEDYGYSIEDNEDEGEDEEVDDMGAEDREEP
jgi:hypothetical protein